MILLLLLIFVISAVMSSHKESIQRLRQFTLFFSRNTFSQHCQCTFIADDHQFHSALHYMLYEKASEYILGHFYCYLYEPVGP